MKLTKRFGCLTSEIEAVYHEAAWKLGLSDSAMRILYTICLYGDSCPLYDIVRLSGISKQTINSALRKLESGGVVETKGARKKRVYLTEQGKNMAQNSALRVLSMEDEILGSWPAEELKLYFDLTEKYLFALQEKVRKL